jgi:hypothetical protein
MPSFSSYFYPRILVRDGKFTVGDHTIDRFVDAIERCFRCTPMFNPGFESFFENRSTQGKVL